MIQYTFPLPVRVPRLAACVVIRFPECVIVRKTSGPLTSTVRMTFTEAELQSCGQD